MSDTTGQPRTTTGLPRADVRLVGLAVVLTAASAGTYFGHAGKVVPFVVSAAALGVLAALVGRSVDRLGDRLGSGATGVVQSALGNLPELFVGIFALRAGLVSVVQSALVGSILANLLLVLGLSFIAGGWRNGTQHFSTEAPRTAVTLLLLAVAVIVVPTLSSHLGLAAAHHEKVLSDVASVVLLVVFALSIPSSLRAAPSLGGDVLEPAHLWPLWLVVVMLSGSSVAAALVSDWFVAALTPALGQLHVSQAFAGLVVVAIAGNAVENFVGISLAMKNRSDYALAVILQSPVQIALVLLPVLVLASGLIGGAALTLVMPVMLVVALAIGTIVTVIVVFDGESTWLEGAALVGLYVTIAASFWWG
ncbi:MAG: sodium:proton exchanger [Acidimicrobiaceae bacterium]|nr:sodium:proton exchanger [Acidimicrobiaceae bacterium]